jgi:Flp pilus assembly protein TadB
MAGTMREGLRTIAHEARPSELEPKLEEAMRNQPLLPHIVEPRNVLRAAAIGLGVALLLYLIFSPMLAALGLIVAFFAAWWVLVARGYEKKRSAEN